MAIPGSTSKQAKVPAPPRTAQAPAPIAPPSKNPTVAKAQRELLELLADPVAREIAAVVIENFDPGKAPDIVQLTKLVMKGKSEGAFQKAGLFDRAKLINRIWGILKEILKEGGKEAVKETVQWIFEILKRWAAGAPSPTPEVPEGGEVVTAPPPPPADSEDFPRAKPDKPGRKPGKKPSKPAEPPADVSSGKYTIKRGDNLTRLAKKFGTTIDALMKANPQIKNRDLIYAGATLNIPTAAKAAQADTE